jgi:deazaflavin-dependent oxidoreductase (nitroreductase family)
MNGYCITDITMQIEAYKDHWFYTLMKNTLASRPGSWFFSRTLHIFDRIVARLSAERTTFTELLGGIPAITLTTTGARSGLSRSTPLVGFALKDEIVIIASNFGKPVHPAWYLNLKANPQVMVTYKGRSEPYRARTAQGPEREAGWQLAVDCFPGYEAYRKRAGKRPIPVVLLSPDGR